MAYQRASAGRDKKVRIGDSGVVHVYATFNNTIVTLTDVRGNKVTAASAGSSGFSGSRKSTPYGAQMAAESVAGKAKSFGIKSVDVYVKGAGMGRESVLRSLQSFLTITSIRDVTPLPHNGVRLRKPPRA